MGKCEVTYREVRFLINELTEVYVRVDADGDCPMGLQGWHYKAFPPGKVIEEILQEMFNGVDDCILWGQQAPK